MEKRSKVARKIMKTKCWHMLGDPINVLMDLEAKIKLSHDNRRSKKEKQMVDIIKSELAKFYSYARSFAKDSGKICPLIVDNQPVTDDLEIAELLKPQYENIFSTPRATMDPIGKESSI